jgi:hypothetical protein
MNGVFTEGGCVAVFGALIPAYWLCEYGYGYVGRLRLRLRLVWEQWEWTTDYQITSTVS